MTDAKVVNCGVDTLVVNVYYTDLAGKHEKRELDEGVRAQLEAWKRAAQEHGEPMVTTLSFTACHY